MSKITALIMSALGIAACTRSEVPSISGAEVYANYCSACHGVTGEGDGPVAAVMQVNVPNLRTLAARSNGTFPTDAVTAYVDGRNLPVSHGDRQMPIWGNVFGWNETSDDAEADRIARERIAAVVEYLKQIQYK